MAFVTGIIIAIIALGAAAAAAFMGIQLEDYVPIGASPLVVGWAFGLIVLLSTAFASRQNTKARFEMIIASEVIVVYGITTLVLSIGLGVSRTADVWVASSGPPPLDQLVPAMRTFAEGFIAAGISPFCAVALRQIDVLARRNETDEEVESVGSVSDELENLRAAIGNAAGAANVFATALNTASERVEKAAESAADALEETAASGARAKAGLIEAGQAATAASEQFRPAADQLARLGESADEGATLVNGLRDLISAVEQFIPSGRSGSSR